MANHISEDRDSIHLSAQHEHISRSKAGSSPTGSTPPTGSTSAAANYQQRRPSRTRNIRSARVSQDSDNNTRLSPLALVTRCRCRLDLTASLCVECTTALTYPPPHTSWTLPVDIREVLDLSQEELEERFDSLADFGEYCICTIQHWNHELYRGNSLDSYFDDDEAPLPPVRHKHRPWPLPIKLRELLDLPQEEQQGRFGTLEAFGNRCEHLVREWFNTYIGSYPGTPNTSDSDANLDVEHPAQDDDSEALSEETYSSSVNVDEPPPYTMAASLVGSSFHSLPMRMNIGRITGSPRSSSITSGPAKSNISVQARPVKEEKSLMRGNGISCSIELAEPNVYLSGFDHDNRGNASENAAAIIRGKMILNVHKSAKIKAVTLRFYGKARTEWPEGIPPDKTQFYEEEKIRYQVLPFYNALYSSADVGYGAQCNYVLKNKQASSSSTSLQNIELSRNQTPRKRAGPFDALDQRRLSMQHVQSRSFSKSESPATTVQQKGYKIFHPGVYEYNFEITLDHTCPETMDLPMGNVKWMLDAVIERAGTFKPNLHGIQEILVIRAPDQNSLEQVEPIAIQRRWEDQLHYDIIISGKAFPIGGKIPIAFKLTPLAKVQCHRIKVYVTENVDYYCKDKKVTRKDAQRRILLLEKNAGHELNTAYRGSRVHFSHGGEFSRQEREEAREAARVLRATRARFEGGEPEPLPNPTENLLGDIDLGLDHLVGQTEIEMDVQLPTCEEMRKDKTKMLHPDTSHKNIQVHHWIKIVMRLSRLDAEHPESGRRRHFEISIDSPFHILSCLATREHTSLPEYNAPSHHARRITCGCLDASSTPVSSTGSVESFGTGDATRGADGSAVPERFAAPQVPRLATPPVAHVASTQRRSDGALLPDTAGMRPIHLLRVPSYNPPAFSADDPPPPLETPPPMYDHVIGTPSVDGLAGYFARLAEHDDPVDSEDTEHSSDEDVDVDRTVTRTGGVNVPNPRTPGGRTTSRSMDVSREFMFRPEAFNPRLRQARRDGV